MTGRPPTLSETLTLALAIALPLVLAIAFSYRAGVRVPRHQAAAVTAPELAAHHRRLVNLLYGDTAAARLLQAAYQQYPDRPAVWIYDKVIQDLIQDRM